MRQVTLIESGGKSLPFSFGMAALARFCESEGLALADLATIAEGMSALRALNLVWHGLADGHRREKKQFTLTIDDVGDLLDEDPDLLQKCMDALPKYMPQADEGNAPAPGKQKARR